MKVSIKQIQQVAAFLGSKKSPRKTAACRANAKKPRPGRRKKVK